MNNMYSRPLFKLGFGNFIYRGWPVCFAEGASHFSVVLVGTMHYTKNSKHRFLKDLDTDPATSDVEPHVNKMTCCTRIANRIEHNSDLQIFMLILGVGTVLPIF